jgi:hypothetical protein
MGNTDPPSAKGEMVKRILLTWVYRWCTLSITMVLSDQFLTIPVRDGVCGVYLLLREGKVVYAGQSLNVFTRIGQHHQLMVRMRKGLKVQANAMKPEAYVAFDEVRIKQCAKRDLDKEEIILIQRYMPQHNTLMKRVEQPRHFDSLSKQDFFQEFMLKEERKQAGIPRRKLPSAVARVEQSFRNDRDRRLKVSLPKLKCMDDVAS